MGVRSFLMYVQLITEGQYFQISKWLRNKGVLYGGSEYEKMYVFHLLYNENRLIKKSNEQAKKKKKLSGPFADGIPCTTWQGLKKMAAVNCVSASLSRLEALASLHSLMTSMPFFYHVRDGQ